MPPIGFSGGTLYFAYGANLCRDHMALWCPESVPLVKAMLPDHRVVFRRWADLAPSAGDLAPGALYEITARDLASLDAFEDYPSLYTRIQVRVWTNRCFFDAMAYRMVPGRPLAPPDPDYLALLTHGYADWNLGQVPSLL